MKNIIIYIYLFLISGTLFSQLTFSNQYPSLSADKYERDPMQINLLPGFKYDANTSPNKLLNLSISYYPNHVNSNYQDPNSYDPTSQISENKVVGVIKGDYNVTPTGQFSYNMPIFCSPGTGGIEPKLNICYSSLGVNGNMGIGFNISGLSSISRTNKTKFYDGVLGSPEMSALDVFAIDGKRLFANSGVYGQNNSTYVYQQNDYSTITSFGSQGVGPQYFEVKDAQGFTAEYGKTADSRLMGVNDNSVLNWHINKVIDEFGNYMTFKYINNNGEVLIDEIKYTGNSNASLAPYNTITFDYMERSDKNVFFVGGKEFNSTKILRSITCKDLNGSIVRKYTFVYTFNVYSQLYKIVEVDADGNELNPTVFTWGSPGTFIPGKPYPNSYSNFGAYYGICPVDFNGDGYADLSGLDVANARVYTRINSLAQLPTLNFTATSPQLVNLTNPGGPAISYLGVFNGDEDEDQNEEQYVFYMQKTSAFIGNKYLIDKIKTGPGNAVSITNIYSHVPNSPINLHDYDYSGPNPPFQGYENNPKPFLFDLNDYTGDGNKDQLIVDQENITVVPLINNVPGTPAVVNSGKYSMVKPGDVDGDGKLELFCFSASTYANPYYLSVLRYDNTTQQLNGINMFLQLNKTPKLEYHMKTIDVGDFNGDGKSDVLTFDPAQSKSILIYLSTGTQFASPLSFNLPTGFTNSDDVFMFFKDVNNDGKADIVVKKITVYLNNVPNQSDYRILYSSGKNIVEDPTSHIQPDMLNNTCFADFNADGNLDYYTNSQNSSFYAPFYEYIDFNHVFSNKNFFLKEIKNCKEKTEIEYSFLRSNYDNNHIDNVDILTDGVNAIYVNETPAQQLPSDLKIVEPGIYVATRVKNNLSTSFYSYTNGIFHKAGNGFLGFQKFTTATKEANNYTGLLGSETEFNYNIIVSASENSTSRTGVFNFIAPNPPTVNNAKIYKLTLDPNNISTKNYSGSNYIVTNGNKYYANYAATEVIDYLKSTKNSEYIQYDNTKKGAATLKSSTVFNWLNSAQVRQQTESSTYILNNGVYKIQNSTTQLTQQGEPTFTRDFSYTYDGSGHLLTEVSDPSLPSLSITKTFSQFNGFGSPTKIDISAPDIQTRTNNLEFDNTGRFNTKFTDALGNIEEFIYETKQGNLVQMKDATGLITKYKYDGLGSLVETTYPNNVVSKLQFNWDTQLFGYFNGSYSITTTQSGSAKKITVYDNNDNLRLTIIEGFNGNTIASQNTYDTRGRITEKTDLHFTNQSKYNKTQFIYENVFYRILDQKEYSVVSAVSTLKSRAHYNYNLSSINGYNKGYTEVVNYAPNNSVINKIKNENNEAGQIDRITNTHGNSATHISDYLFSSNAKPKEVNLTFPDGGTGKTQFTYDALGRQNSLIDQSAGTNSYVYNSIGDLIQETTPLGNFTFTYDLLSRINSKTGSVSGITTYQYVTAANGKNQIEKIIGPNVTTEFKYDNLGRQIEQKETIGPKVFKTNYGYDSYSNVVNYTYPNNYQIDYVYDNIGTLIKIKNGNTVIWQLNAEFAPGKVSQYVNANGVSTSVAYDNYLNLQDITYGTLNKQEYDFDYITGNLKERKFTNSSNVINYEKFTFDAVQRLNSVYDNVGNTTNVHQNINYKDNGNISYKSDAGSYVYGLVNKPYNLTAINNPANNISLNTLNVSYNDIRKINQITESSTNKQMNFVYGNDGQRIKVDYIISSNNQYTRYYAQNYDREETTNGYKEWNYIYAPTGLTAIYYNNNGTGQLLYTITDHLGSPVLITNSSAQILEEYNFDAWGRRRNPANWTYNSVPVPAYLNRGYTMHEHIDEFALINMNGRVYDPVLGRFIQPDNYVQSPDNLQNFNRYGYVYNNPLKYTDPSGNYAVVDDIAAALIGGFANVYTNWGNLNNGGGGWNTFGRGLAAFGAGAVGGIGAIYPEFGGWVWGGATVGATNAWLAGATEPSEYIEAAAYGVIGSVVGGMIGGAVGPVIGGTIGRVVTNPVAANVIGGAIGGGASGYLTGFALSYMYDGDVSNAFKNAASAGKAGFITGAISGLASSIKIKSSRQGKETPERLEMKEINKIAQDNDIDFSQREIIESKTVNYLEQMENGTFTNDQIAIYKEFYKITISDGHHRVAASIQYGVNTGDFSIFISLMNNARVTPQAGSRYVKTYKYIKIKG